VKDKNKDIEKKESGSGWKSIIHSLSFMAFGVSAFSNPLDRMNVYNILFGVLIGLVFGWIFKSLLKGFLGLFNGKTKKEKGKRAIKIAVDNGMLFTIPFAVMLVLATFVLNWSMTIAFVSAGIMAVGTATAIEIGKLKGKQEIKNTILTSGMSFVFSFAWTLSYQFLAKAPSFIEGGIAIIKTMLSGGGGMV